MKLFKGMQWSNNFLQLLSASFLAIGLMACGGGGGGSEPIVPDDTTPNAFSFTAQNDVALNTLVESNSITLAGIDTAASISVTGGEYSISGGAFTSTSATVTNAQSVVVRLTSSDLNSTTTQVVVTIGGVSGTFSVTTLADTTPDAFVFSAQTGVALNTLVESNSITIAGINSATSISIAGGEYSIAGGTFTSASGTITSGQSVIVRQTSSTSYSATTEAVLTIGGINGAFSITTIDDTTPDAFIFTDQTDVALSTVTESNSITVVGINVATSISITGGEYSIDGGSFTSSEGTVSLDQTVIVRQTSSAINSTTTDAILTIGGVSDTFSVTTEADTTPAAFTFTAQTEIGLTTLVESSSASISGIAAVATISVIGGEYAINGGDFTGANGTIENGQSVVVRQTSSSESETTTEAILTIGDVNGTFSVTTQGKFNFEGFTGVALNARLQTNIVTISDIGDATPVSIENGEYSVNKGVFTTEPGFINNDQTIRVRAIAGADYNVTTTARLDIGESWGVFKVTTKDNGDFTSVWKTDNPGVSNDNQIKLPLESSGTYDFTVSWGDGTSDAITQWDQAEVTHTYPDVGEYTVIIQGTIVGFGFKELPVDQLKIIEIKHWGALLLGNNREYFLGASNLIFTGNDALDLAGTTNMRYSFSQANFNGNISNWDVSKVTDMGSMFNSVSNFNEDLSLWDVSNVTDMNNMFLGATLFNSAIGSWDVSKVTNMSNMFFGATLFNSAIGSWDVSNVTDMSLMFAGGEGFDIGTFSGDLSQWDVSKVNNMYGMFFHSTLFNSDISGWDISQVTNMGEMLSNSGLAAQNYSSALVVWSQLPNLQTGVSLSAGGVYFNSSATSARNFLVNDKGWTITDAGLEPVSK